jgi:hypothetical protein
MAKEIRRFPPPWSIIESDESFTVIDATGFKLAYLRGGSDLWAFGDRDRPGESLRGPKILNRRASMKEAAN